MSFAGNTCTDWSHIGSRMERAGKSMRTLYLYIAELAFLQPDWAFTECTERFEPALFAESLPQYQVESIVV